MIRGLIQVALRGGGMMHLAASCEDEPTLQTVLGEIAADVNRGSDVSEMLHAMATPQEVEAHRAKVRAYEADDLFQLRPGLWVRRREVIGLGFVPEGLD